MSSHSLSLKYALLLSATFGASCIAPRAGAEEFSWQLSGGTNHAEAGNSESDSWSVDATYFVDSRRRQRRPIRARVIPGSEDARIGEASGTDSGLDVVDDPSAYTLSGRYVLPSAKWYVGADYSKADADYDSPFVKISDPKGYGVLAGRYLGAEHDFGARRRQIRTTL